MKDNKIHHGMVTEAIANTNGLKKTTDEEEGIVRYAGENITITVPKTLEIKLITHKLLMYAIMLFTSQNKTNKYGNAKVTFSVADFLRKCDLSTDNKSSVDRGRTEIMQSLQVLIHMRMSISEGHDKYAYHNDNMQLFLEKSQVKNGIVFIHFSFEFANYLGFRPIAEYPHSLFKINGKKRNAYNIAYKMALHHSINANKFNGTANTLGVKSLLKNSAFPSMHTLVKSRESWRHKILYKFEYDLDYLVFAGVLDSWQFRDQNNIFLKYPDFINEKIDFRFTD